MAQRPFRIFALPLARLPRTRPPLPAPPTSAARPLPAGDDLSSASSSTSTSSLPDASTTAQQQGEKPNPLLLFQVSQPDPAPPSTSSSRWTAGTIVNRALNGATNQWLKLGEKPKDGWMYWFYAKGEGLMDKIEFEEWMLKGIHEGRGVEVLAPDRISRGETQQKIQISLLRPELDDGGPPLPPLVPRLHRMLAHRIPYHKKMMWRSILFSPVTWPFAIIPVVPNFPLFYVLWRAWSHYRAWRGAYYLEQLLQLGMISEQPSKQLSEVYASHGVKYALEGETDHAPDETTSEGVKNKPGRETGGDGGPGTQAQGKRADEEELGAQEKGEKVGSGDTTATPDSMVYHPPSSTTAKTEGGPAPTSQPSSGVRHPSLLLTHAQVPLLQRTFDLRPNEIMDIDRAIDQADLRAKAIDRRNAMDTTATATATAGQEAKGQEATTKWRGNLHR